MIARYVTVAQVRRLKFKGHVVSNSAHVVADGIDQWIVLGTADEVAWAEKALDSGAKLVLSITEESPS